MIGRVIDFSVNHKTVVFAVTAFACIGGLMAGCGSDGPDATPTTPSGQSTVAITATGPTAIQQTTVSLTVQ